MAYTLRLEVLEFEDIGEAQSFLDKLVDVALALDTEQEFVFFATIKGGEDNDDQ